MFRWLHSARDRIVRAHLGGRRVGRRSPGAIDAAMLPPAAMVWAVGGFDETLDRGESMDLVHRAVQSGLTITSVDEPVLQRRLHGHNTGQGVSDHTDYLRVAHQAILRLREAPER